ncbi:Mitochondrial distribution and morphology protein 12, partial [Candida maltosa Xu316]
MSLDINWEKLTEDDSTINESIKEFLDQQFQKISLPSFISNLTVTDFNLGKTPPDIIIRHIGDPFDEFYEDEYDNQEHPKEEDLTKQETRGDEDDQNGEASDSNDDSDDDDDTYDDDEDDDDDDDEEEEDDDDDDEEEEGEVENGLGSISEGVHLLNFNRPMSPVPLKPPPMNRSRDSYQSILHPYGVSGIIGANTTGTDTPTNLLNQNYLQSRVLPKITTKQKQPRHEENDLQLFVELNYKGDLYINLEVNLLVNYPSPNFISLPIKLHVTDIEIHSLATIAYLKKSVFLSILCDVNDKLPEFTATNGGDFVEYYMNDAINNRESIDIIKKIKIESEIGEGENSVLRNVGKVEKFLIEQLRKILRDELAWPSWICLDMNDDDEKDENDEEEDEEEEVESDVSVDSEKST